jgi:hypothetical protein
MPHGDGGPSACPAFDAIECDALVGLPPPRLEVISEDDPDPADRSSAAIA